MLAVNPSDSILGLVGFAWAGFGSAFGPLVLASLYWKRLNAPGAIAGMVTGAVVVFAWGNLGGSDIIYEMVPGFIAAAVVMVAVTLLTSPPKDEVTDEFDQAVRLSKVFKEDEDVDIETAAVQVKGSGV